MKTRTILLFTIFTSTILLAQNNQVSLNTGYINQSFYSMQNGEVLNISNNDWDIAFSTNTFSSTIRTNDGKGVELYTYHLSDTSGWNNIDNNSINNLPPLMFNSDTSWSYGAFDINQVGGLDYGWGVYNMQTHHVIGDSLFIIKTINSNWKKLWIESKISGEYQIKYANLDGSNLVNATIPASNYTDKNFVYYSLDNQLILDREPNKDAWDITFTKYMTLYPTSQGTFMPYSVTGVFQNNDVTVAQADNINSPLTYNNYNLHAFSSIINTIGFDWKIFQGTYLIMDDLCYFIRDQENKIWRLTFTAFDGTSTGNIEFNTELIASTEIQDLEAINTFKIYPNPVSNGQAIQLIYELQHSTHQGIVKLYDISGREVYSSNLNNRGLRSHSIATNALCKGLYTISINIDGVIKTDHIVIN